MPQQTYTDAPLTPKQTASFTDAPLPSSAPAPQPDWIDKLTEWLPAVGGTVGGVVGTAGGPIGTVGGAALGGMAGEAYKELINRARGRNAPSTPMQVAEGIGTQGAVQGGAEAVGMGLGAVAKPLGARLMQSAVKPGLTVLLKGAGKDVQPVVQTLLDEGVNVTPGGIQKLQTLIGSTNADIKAALAPHAQKEIPALRVASRLSPLTQDAINQVNAPADMEAISQVGENFLANPNISARGTLTLAQAQAMKQGTYKRIGEKYGKVSSDAIQAEKGLARGLKEEIAAEVPDISALNAREGRLLEALDVAGRRVALAGNKDPVGFAFVAAKPMTFLAALMDRSPAVKSLLARGLYNHAGQIAKVSPALIRTAMVAIASGDQPDASASASTDQGGPR